MKDKGPICNRPGIKDGCSSEMITVKTERRKWPTFFVFCYRWMKFPESMCAGWGGERRRGIRLSNRDQGEKERCG